jgi:hypothetical protein
MWKLIAGPYICRFVKGNNIIVHCALSRLYHTHVAYIITITDIMTCPHFIFHILAVISLGTELI